MNKISVSEEVEVLPLEIHIHNNNFEDGFRKFKSLIQKEQIITNYKQRMAYEKPSEKIRRKEREAAERKFLTECREREMISGEWDKRQARKEKKRQEKMELASQRRAQNAE